MNKPGSIRIIAGKWRGRKLKVPGIKNLRPTPDRVRETLFNWLMADIEGATCLDAFSGSGALGFEALSRGAEFVVMIDESKKACELLKAELEVFEANNAKVICSSIPRHFPALDHKFDIVFLDPPYHEELLLPTCHYLEDHNLLAKNAYIYLEAPHLIKDNELPADWKVIKHQQAGQVFYHLAERLKK